MADVGSLTVRVGADISDLQKKLASVSSKLGRVGKRAQAVGQSMSTYLTLPLAALGAASVKAFASFDDQMRKVGAISNATGEEMQQLTATAKQLGSSTRFSAREAAEGLEFMALAGFSASESIQSLPSVLNLAASAAIDLGEASDIVTDTMSAFGLAASEASTVSDVLATTQANSNTNVLQLGEAFKMSSANANAFGLNVETLSSTLGIFADAGIKGSRAGTSFNAIIRDLQKSAENGAVAINGQNIALSDSEGNFRDFLDIVQDVEQATEGLTQSQRASALSGVFQEEAIRGVNVLMQRGTGAARTLRAELNTSAGSAAAMAQKMEGGIGGAMRSLRAALEGFAISLGETLAPTVRKIAGFIKGLVNRFQSLSPTMKQIGVVVGAVVAAAGPLLFILGSILSTLPALGAALGVLFSPIGAIGAAVAGLAILVVRNWDQIKEAIVNSKIGELIGQIVNVFKLLWETGKAIFTQLAELVSEQFDKIGGETSVLTKVIDFMVGRIQATFNNLLNTAATVFKFIGIIISVFVSNVKQYVVLIRKIFRGDWKGAFEAAKNIVRNIFAGIVKIIESALTGGIKLLKTFIGQFTDKWDDSFDNAISKVEEYAVKTAEALGFEKEKKELDDVTEKVDDFTTALKNAVNKKRDFSLSLGGGSGTGSNKQSNDTKLERESLRQPEPQKMAPEPPNLIPAERIQKSQAALKSYKDEMVATQETAIDLNSAMQDMTKGLVDGLITAAKEGKSAVQTIVNTIMRVVSAYLAQAVATVVSSRAIGGPGVAAAAGAGMAAAFKATVPSFAVGTNEVPQDMLAQVHKGEMIVPKKFNPSKANMGENMGGNVMFRISGNDLIGVLQNAKSTKSRILGG